MKQHPLKTERVLRGWSQARVAEALNTTVRTISRWEQGQALPYPFYREQLCQLFGKDARQLGLLPGQDTKEEEEKHFSQRELLSSVQVSSPELAPVVDPDIPKVFERASSLVGREQVLRQARSCLIKKGCLALHGLPGVGKTALSVALATDAQVQARFSDGILWASLGPQANRLSSLMHWGSLLGITTTEEEKIESQEDWRRALQSIIGQRRLLLIIDDVWSLPDALALQIGGPECACLLTTRLPQLAFAFAQEKLITLRELPEDDGLELLVRVAPRLVQQQPEEARLLVGEVGGLPLALTLVGKYLATHCLPDQPHRVQRALALLHQSSHRLQIDFASPFCSPLPPDTPLSLFATFATSDHQLPSPAHEALCALSVFPARPASFTEEAALVVSAAPVEILDELWDAGLLESHGPGRYSFHQMVVHYAQMHGKDAAAKRRLVHYIASYIDEHQRDYVLIEREMPVLWTALELAGVLEMWPELVRGGMALVPLLRVRGLYSQASSLLQHVLHAAQQLEDQATSANVLFYLAEFTDLSGDYAREKMYSQQGLVCVRQLESPELQSKFLFLFGNMRSKQGDYAQARHLLEEGLSYARADNDPEHTCRLLNALGAVLYYQGQYNQSDVSYREALALARQTGHPELVSQQLAALGTIEQEQSHASEAEACSHEGLRLAWQVGYQAQRCLHLSTLGVLATQRGFYSQAEAYYQSALALARQISHRATLCKLLIHLSDLCELRKHYARAEIYCQEGVELTRQAGLRYYLASLLLRLGYAIGQQDGPYHRAENCFRESLEIAQQLAETKLLVLLNVYRGEIFLKYQELNAAHTAFASALQGIGSSEQYAELKARAQLGQVRIAEMRRESCL